ncbi:hypothetical protein PAPYR_75 [Paratrimastix pyriformis]|uniref:AMP-activated protein kinase glycogen-binding domain-containing protein n=1 Tax=Paratrimastix pyriformis TaxID=342808 RepID=A0ABQ8UXN4_9EUKA|nr:hypothetical protein PAPYR_75 [Paratrimastix pyriformis]
MPNPRIFFQFRSPDHATRVELCGSFTNWKDHVPMSSIGNHMWGVQLEIIPGEHQYKYILNGNDWVINPSAPFHDDGHGNLNNVLKFKAPPPPPPLPAVDPAAGIGRTHSPRPMHSLRGVWAQRKSLQVPPLRIDHDDDEEYVPKEPTTPPSNTPRADDLTPRPRDPSLDEGDQGCWYSGQFFVCPSPASPDSDPLDGSPGRMEERSLPDVLTHTFLDTFQWGDIPKLFRTSRKELVGIPWDVQLPKKDAPFPPPAARLSRRRPSVVEGKKKRPQKKGHVPERHRRDSVPFPLVRPSVMICRRIQGTDRIREHFAFYQGPH